MAVLTATFETGVNGIGVSTSDAGSATAWDVVNGSPTYDNTHAYGHLSMFCNASGKYAMWSTALGTVTDHYGRVYIYMETTPIIACQFVRIYRSGSLAASAVFVNSSGKLVIGDSVSALGTSLTSVALNQWVRVEYHVIHSGTVGFVEAKLFNAADSNGATETITSDADNNTLVNANEIRIGLDAGGDSAVNTWVDNVVAGADTYPGPATTTAQTLSMLPHVSGHNTW